MVTAGRDEGGLRFEQAALTEHLRFAVAGPQPGDGEATEIGDGGFTDWTAKLLANRKERLLISGYGLDRIAVSIC